MRLGYLVLHTPMAYNRFVLIVETSVFTRWVQHFLADDEYRELQDLLVVQPHLGKVIQGGDGLRKTRFSYNNLGKSKALRVIYYYAEVSSF